MVSEARIAFVGAGTIAEAHAFALAALPYYYSDTPRLARVAVAAATPESRQRFAARYGFVEAPQASDLWRRNDIDSVFILGPNVLHYAHLRQALAMDGVRRVYVEKPICVTPEEEDALAHLAESLPAETVIQAGFQFLQMASVRQALRYWRTAAFGAPIHFHARYLHSGYLEPSYRAQRRARLHPAPAGGAMADLGSHALSLLIAFLGEELEVVAAQQSGSFPDVPAASDLCTTALLRDRRSGAAGTAVASRISAGAGELLEFELRSTGGALRLSTERPDVLEVCTAAGQGVWQTISCGSDYLPITKFPARNVSAGWLRSLLHAHYLFFGGADEHATLPDLSHALAVQRLLRQTAEHLAAVRSNYPTTDYQGGHDG